MPQEAVTNAVSLADVMQKYGGWGLSAVLLILLVWLFVYFMEKLEKRNTCWVELLTGSTAAIREATEATKQAKEELKMVRHECERLQARLDNLTNR